MATESVKILIEAEDQATAQLQKTIKEQEKVAAKSALIKQQQEQALQAERIALEQGAEAAEAYKLTLLGLDAQTAKLIASEKMLVQQQKQANAELSKQPSGLKSTKATTEFFGAVAGMAGGSEIASIAGQLAGLTEKTGQFSEVAKAGGASALLFKAGIVAAAGAIGLQVGQAIGNVVFQTEKVNKELDVALEKLKRLEGIRIGQLQQGFRDFVTDLEFAPDKAAAAAEELDRIKNEIGQIEQAKQAREASLKEMQQQGELSGGKALEMTTIGLALDQGETAIEYLKTFGGEYKANLKLKQEEIDQNNNSLEQLRAQATELERMQGIEAERAEKRKAIEEQKASDDYIAGLKDQLAELNAELGGTKKQLDALRNTNDGQSFGIAEGLLEEIDAANEALKAQQKAEQEKEQAAQKEKDRLKQIAELRQSEADKIKEQAIALAQGKEAAHAFRLEKQGLGADEAKRIAAEQAEIDKLNEMKSQKATKTPSLQAVESRLLTRGPDQDPVAKNTAEIAKLAQQHLAKLNSIDSKTKPVQPTSTTTVELVSK